MAKRKFDHAEEQSLIEGYISDLSPVKTSQNKRTRYFTGILQTKKEEKVRMVCFSPEKHPAFQQAANSTDSYRLTNAKLTPGRNQELEIKVFKECMVEKSARKLDFSKHYSTLVSTEEPETSTELADLKEYEMANVNVKCLGQLESNKTVHTRFGPRNISTYLVGDQSKVMKMTVWTVELQSKLQRDNYYHISKINSKQYDNALQISTTSETSIHTIPAFEDCMEDCSTVLTTKTLKAIQFESVQITKKLCCKVCFANIESAESLGALFKCKSCNFKQNVTKLPSQLVAKAYIEEQQVMVDNQCLMALLEREDKQSLSNDNDALEDFLMLNNFDIVLCDNIVSSIIKV